MARDCFYAACYNQTSSLLLPLTLGEPCSLSVAHVVLLVYGQKNFGVALTLRCQGVRVELRFIIGT
jgi:hypothetical protein